MTAPGLPHEASVEPFIQRVRLRNYKSIASCDVRLDTLTFLVGRNGSGKSNFLDALRFVADSLRSSLDHAMRDRGGIKEVRRRSSGHPTHFAIELDFRLSESVAGRYEFEVGARAQGGFEVAREECEVVDPKDAGYHRYRVEKGKLVACTVSPAPVATGDRLYLVNASGLPPFRPVYDALSQMGFYNLNPERIRDLQAPDAGELLARDGANLASVLQQLRSRAPQTKLRIEEYLARVVPGVRGVDTKVIGPRETLEFRQELEGTPNPWHFLASSMSDGTLRALGLLVALFQPGGPNGAAVRLVGIEEPEVALHPAAAGVLFDSLCDASRTRQIVVTSHSPDLLDTERVEPEMLLGVRSERGVTRIGALDRAGVSCLQDHLYTAGELLRQDQLQPALEPEVKPVVAQLDLFQQPK